MEEKRLKQLKEVQNNLGYFFKTITLLNCALTHKSYANEGNKNLEDNERLEFLGDAVIDIIISDYFYKNYPNFNEGDLTKTRAALVNESTLSKISKDKNLGEYILLGRGEEMTGGKEKPSILANVFEAVIASIYLDSNINETYKKLIEYAQKEIDSIAKDSQYYRESQYYNDYKSKLQESSQQKYNTLPLYKTISESGPDHDKSYTIEVIINSISQGQGNGKSKKEAEQEAAKNALNKIFSTKDLPLKPTKQ